MSNGVQPNTTKHDVPVDDHTASLVGYVFVARGIPLGFLPVTPRRLFFWLLGLAIRAATLSPIAHCSLGDGACVLDCTFERVAYRPFDAYLLRFPGLVGYYQVPLKGPLDLEAPGLRHKAALGVFVQWLTAGRVADPASCVTVTAQRLRRAGVPVPRLATPGGLRRWLAAEGYSYESLE